MDRCWNWFDDGIWLDVVIGSMIGYGSMLELDRCWNWIDDGYGSMMGLGR